MSYVSYVDTRGLTTSFNHASFYSYDIHGNVDTLLQDYGLSGARPNMMNKNGNRYKKIVYKYDLISGKVNQVKYQPRFSDQWTHRYFYDAENRLTEVQTSEDGYTWEKEARYEYYLHGPLARTVLGQQQVQGMDYAYTLQGWLKGINSSSAAAAHDIGGDARAGGGNQYVGRDAIGLSLNYFDGEYKPIAPGVMPFPSYRNTGTAMPDSVYRPLYNGNISSALINIRKFEENGHKPVFYNYRYDQLNRYVGQDGTSNAFDTAANGFTGWAPSFTFRERVSYDANGNIQRFDRHNINAAKNTMDSLTYQYYAGTNQLRRVTDAVPDGAFGNSWDKLFDIDNQADTSNYVYDSIGNLVADKSEKITGIKWNVYGKITEIRRNPAITDQNTTFWTRYRYDAQGNRIGKTYLWYNKTYSRYELDYTWYVRDAQGNLMSTYSSTSTDTAESNLPALFVQQKELPVYGSSRLGVYYPENRNGAADNAGNTGPWINYGYYGTTHYRGARQYELSNHLGNVLTIINDRKIGVYSGSSLIMEDGVTTYPAVSYYEAEKLYAYDYYPFGMVSRVTGNNLKYRFGFNGQESSDEIKGFGNSYTAQYWEYDPRIGRRWNLDPKPTLGISQYSAFNSNPVRFCDLLGDTILLTDKFKNDELLMASYKNFQDSKGGRELIKAFDKGGKFYNVNVIIDAKEEDGAHGTTAAFVIGKDGKKRTIISDGSYEEGLKKGWDMSGYSTKIGKGERLVINVNIDPDYMPYISGPNIKPIRLLPPMFDNRFSISSVGTGLTILHEFQHTFIYSSYLFNPNFKSVGNGSWQHSIMANLGVDSNTRVNYHEQRYDYIRQYGGAYKAIRSTAITPGNSLDQYFKFEANNYAW